MFIFNLNIEKSKLPPIQNWLNPQYNGYGDSIINNEINIRYNNPVEFKKDFVDYIYSYDKLIKLKNLLNKEKKSLDKINDSSNNIANFFRLTNCFRPYDLLRGSQGKLVQEYGAEIVTNAWLKMYENTIFLDEILEKINKSQNKVFNSIHLAEAPGNFILAINHYIKTNHPTIQWNWRANSYKNLYEKDKNIYYLNDAYGLMKKYQDKWMYGADGDGDITSISNIYSFQQDISADIKHNIHLITSDVKYQPKNINYNEEENYNIPVHMGHILCTLTLLSKGGVMILKEFTFFESSSISLLYLLYNCFKQLLIVKPETSKKANSEVYVVGIGYKNNLSKIQIDRLFNIMRYIQKLNNEKGSPAIFRKDDIPDDFIEQIIKLSTKLLNIQIPSIRKNISLYEKYKNMEYSRICKDFITVKEKTAKEWIDNVKIKELSLSDRVGTKSTK